MRGEPDLLASSGEKLSAEVVDAFRRKSTELPAPVLVHCASGAPAPLMMHIACENGMSGEEVIQAAEEMSFECGTLELGTFAKDYVNSHNGNG